MSNAKLTDTEIKKALECCTKAKNYHDCKRLQCPLYRECKIEYQPMEDTVIPYALDLINRKDQENESLKAEVERLRKAIEKTDYAYFKKSCEFDNLIYDIELLKQEKSVVKAEAYKECIEKVEQIICDNTYPDFDINHKAVNIWKAEAYKNINNLLNELVGDKNAGEN